MPHRILDILFQYLGRMTIGLLVVPALVGAAIYVGDRSATLTTRVWAATPVYLTSASLSKEFAGVSPAAGTQALALELLASDSFLDSVLLKAEPGFTAAGPDGKAADRARVRSSLKFTIPGPNLLVISYSTSDPAAGVAFLNQFIATMGASLVSIQTAQANGMVSSVVNQLPAAQAAMQDALAKVNAYGPGASPTALARDPRYQTLVADAQAKTQYYISLEDLVHQAELLKEEVPNSSQAMFRVLDPPAADPRTIDLRTPFVRYALLALAGVAVAEGLLLYLLAVRDPRVRSGREVRAQLGIQLLGSTPRVVAR